MVRPCRGGETGRLRGARQTDRRLRKKPEARRLASVRGAQAIRYLVELAPQLLDRRVLFLDVRIFGFELGLFHRHLAEIGDREPPAEYFIAADLELGLAFGGQTVADRLKIADQVVERSIVADV